MARTTDDKHGSHAHSATDDLKETAAEIGESIRDIKDEVGTLAREKFDDFRDQATGYYKKGRKKAVELEKTVEGYIQDEPVKALLIAAGVGFLVGMFWRRR
jgi:ElaB/YqjD/DUF883 family membrane-anchored ribosome-binding protein